MNDFWSYWYFHIPNFILAAVMYTLLGRLVLGLFVPENWDNYIWRGFKAITDPFLRVVRIVTPCDPDPAGGDGFRRAVAHGLRIGYLVVADQSGRCASPHRGAEAMDRNTLVPVMAVAIVNGIFSPWVLMVFLLYPVWYPGWAPAYSQIVYMAAR